MNANLLRLPVLLLILLISTSILAAQKRTEDWLPFTPAEQQMKESPGGGAASAVQLYYAHHEDHNTSALFIHQRIKVLNENGRSYANVEIPFLDDSSYLEDLKARTIQPDGRIVEFRGKPFEKTVVKARGVSFLAKAFTLPEVNVGSIIEYKYRLRWQSRTYGNTDGLCSAIYSRFAPASTSILTGVPGR